MLVFIIRLCLIVGIVISGITYYLWVFDRAQRTPERAIIAEAGASAIARALFIALLEGLGWGLAILSAPFSFLGDFLGWNRHRSDHRPVLMVHGYLHNRTAWVAHGLRLRRNGWGAVYSINLWPPTAPLDTFAEQVGEAVDRICRDMGCDDVDIVAHSMGGVVSRAYIQNHGGRERVAHLVTLGSPHHGTRTAPLGPFPNSVGMSIGSPFLTDLEADPDGLGDVVATAIYSEHDNIVIPAESAGLPEPARTEVVSGMGHVGLLWSSRVYDLIRDGLTDAGDTASQDAPQADPPAADAAAG